MNELKGTKKRQLIDITAKATSSIAAFIGIFFLGWILATVIQKGASSLRLSFFTELPAPSGIEGGLGNAVLGTLIMTVLATLISVPFGLLAGIYLSEFGKGTKMGTTARFFINITTGIPSIVIGLFVYTLFVLPFGHFSAWAGVISLAVIMLPIVAAITDDTLSMVSNTLRESALAIGTPHWKTVMQIVFKQAKPGIITGVLLAIARISGETAPLLFTAMNSQYWISSLREPTANLTVAIYNYAMSPYDDWKELAWGASLLIMIAVLTLNIMTRLFFQERKQ